MLLHRKQYCNSRRIVLFPCNDEVADVRYYWERKQSETISICFNTEPFATVHANAQKTTAEMRRWLKIILLGTFWNISDWLISSGIPTVAQRCVLHEQISRNQRQLQQPMQDWAPIRRSWKSIIHSYEDIQWKTLWFLPAWAWGRRIHAAYAEKNEGALAR